MKKVFGLSVLLIAGLVFSQVLPLVVESYKIISHVIKLGTMVCLSFIMIHVGYEFDIQKGRLKEYGYDYLIAFTAATFPWIFVTIYFVMFLIPEGTTAWDSWTKSLLAGRFAAPTSAGVLFSMLAAAGLGATWVFRKTRILAIFDDLDTVLLMIPLQMLIIGFKFQLVFVVGIMFIQIWLAWKYMHFLRISVRWHYVLFYSALISGAAELIYLTSKIIDETVTAHIEVLLPAFVLGTIISRQHNRIRVNGAEEDILELKSEKKVTFAISAVFMVLVGLSMPVLEGISGDVQKTIKADEEIVSSYIIETDKPLSLEPQTEDFEWDVIFMHVIFISLISNIGKIVPAFVYRKEAHWKHRLAVAVSMFPRGEVGAGILIISMSYGISGMILTVAMLSLALNLLLTGFFILIVKRLIASSEK